MDTPKISVIVPVYKVEAYLDKCVSSIVNQTYKNLEIILVDDGSPDNCPAMCDAWAEKDRRIQVIHKENNGAGAARNTGLDTATGEMIAFVDSDDYLAADMFAYLYSLLSQGADLAECNYIEVFDDSGRFKCDDASIRKYTTSEALTEHIHDHAFRQVIWNKLYRRSILEGVRFPVGMLIDDEFFTYKVLGNAKTLIHSDRICYAYRQQPDSVTHAPFSPSWFQAVEAKCLRLDFLKEHFPALVSAAKINLWYSCLYLGQMSLLHMHREERRQAFHRLKHIRKQFPVTYQDIKNLPSKKKIWIFLSKISFFVTCKLRNRLKKGF